MRRIQEADRGTKKKSANGSAAAHRGDPAKGWVEETFPLYTVLGESGDAKKSEVTLSDKELRMLYRWLVLNRQLDERMITLQRQGRVGFYIGSIGEEASIIGSAYAMRDQDWIFPCYREHGAALLRGMPLSTYVCDLFGNAGDAMKGRQ